MAARPTRHSIMTNGSLESTVEMWGISSGID